MSFPQLMFPLPTLDTLGRMFLHRVSLLVALVCTCLGLLWIHVAGWFYILLVPLLVSLLVCSRLDDFTLISLLVSLLVSLVSTCLGLLWIRLAG